MQNFPSNRPASENFFEAETIDLLHYWGVLMRSKTGIISLGILFAIITALVMAGKEDVYTATSSILIEPNRANVTSIEEIYGLESQSREYINSQFQLFNNRTLAERVINEFGLLDNPEFILAPPSKYSLSTWINKIDWQGLMPGSASVETPAATSSNSGLNLNPNPRSGRLILVIEMFRGRLTVEPVPNTNLVNVSFQAEDPQLAAGIANALAKAYIENNQEQKILATSEASTFLTERLAELKIALDESEQTLQDFLEAENLLDIDGVSSLNVQELNELTTQSVIATQTAAQTESIYRQLQDLQNPSVEELLTFPAVLNHQSIQSIRLRSSDINEQVSQLSSRYGRNHPRMIALASEQQTINDDLSVQVQQVVANIENDYLSALNNEETLKARLERSKVDLQGINSKTYELRGLERAVLTNQELYDLFYTRVRETEQTNEFQTSNAVIVDPAFPPIFPSGPKRKLMIMIAMVAGLMIGAMFSVLRDLLDNTIKNHIDIEERLHVPVLGVVPYIKRKGRPRDKEHAYLGFLEDKQSTFAESIRTIRASITLSSLDKPHKVIEITSSVPNEGKSTLSVNLAIAMGQLNKVLLIDTDLRRPSLQKSIEELPIDALGLADYLAGTAELKDCLHHIERANITVMPAGQMTPNPQELLSSMKFRDLLTTLGEHADQIILDTPPTKTVMDSLILGSIVDALIYVVKADSTPTNVIKGELARLKRANTNVIGVVLNQVDVSKKAAENYGGYYDSEGYSLATESS